MTIVDDMDYEFRTARPEDAEAIEALDGSFITRTIFHVAVSKAGFALQEIPVAPPIHKVEVPRLPIDVSEASAWSVVPLQLGVHARSRPLNCG
ncbi:hypothetical protein [Streptomyces sp. NPDC051286]|uniref:hypothetical protein n=1 Tax=Streptomyces sp. NPDC051286 TaxID=3365647 RepID=UPI003789FCDA